MWSRARKKVSLMVDKQAWVFIVTVCKKLAPKLSRHATIEVLPIGFHLTLTSLPSQDRRNIIRYLQGTKASTCSAPEFSDVCVGSCDIQSDAWKGENVWASL